MRFIPFSLTPNALARLAARSAERQQQRQTVVPAKAQERDLRVDFFRGLALWFIFLDHVPSNTIGHLTLRNFGFSDATEIFVFISGYSAAIAYGRSERKLGFVYMTAHVWRRCWQLYVAHLILFIFYTAQIAWLAERFSNSMFIEELNITRFLEAPHIALLEALTLRFRPANLDILPLYIVLLFVFPFVQRALRAAPLTTMAASFALYLAARFLNWNLPTSVEGIGWYFNPFAWQLLFFIGTACAIAPEHWRPLVRWRPSAAVDRDRRQLADRVARRSDGRRPADGLVRVDVPGRQDQHGHPAAGPFPGDGLSRRALRQTAGTVSATGLGTTADRVRQAVPLCVLSRHLPVVRGAFRAGRIQCAPADADRGQRRRHRIDDRARRIVELVSQTRGERFSQAVDTDRERLTSIQLHPIP
jgi:hypothetical protein